MHTPLWKEWRTFTMAYMSTQTTMQFTLGDALRKARTQPKLDDVGRMSQQAMADRLGVSRPTVSSWESGTQPPFSAVVAWAQITGWPLEWFEKASPGIHAPSHPDQQTLFQFAA